jgi:hypothetical protein
MRNSLLGLLATQLSELPVTETAAHAVSDMPGQHTAAWPTAEVHAAITV